MSFSFVCSCAASYGDEETRTPDLRRAKAALSQLSYIPSVLQVGLVGLEPTTSPLSEERSNRLSYKHVHLSAFLLLCYGAFNFDS
jgi:hypothetical protein